MKKIVYSVLVGLILVGCKQEITSSDISKINGYWEIEKVILKNGEDKNYKVNQTVDYFELKGKKGFRQKVIPQLDGSYLTNNLKEEISISNVNGDFYMNYSTPFGKWKEEIIEIRDSILVVKNKDDLEYHYKKQIPFSIK
jgi:hypothetical protein